VKIGRLVDHPTAVGDVDDGRRALDLAVDGAAEIVQIDAGADVARVIDAARRLADAGCAAILGPAVTDFAVPLVPVLDEIRMPSVNWSGSARARGAWAFQLKVGSLPDEAGHLVRLIARSGWHRICIAQDRGPIGAEYLAFLRPGLDALRVRVDAHVEIDPQAADLEHVVERLRTPTATCVVYLGFGPSGVRLCRAMRAVGWRVPVIGNIGLGVRPSPDIEGAVFTDVIDETNPILVGFAERFAARFGSRPSLLTLAAAHDLGVAIAEAIRLAPVPTPGGVRAGLERIQAVPAACGAPGTTIAFSSWDRDGYKGPLLVYRQIRDGRATRYTPAGD